ncbi:hypothetical protein RHODO2019_15525 [Rhodococcus antarcticus]|uniref:Uncharacterized protein n=1 Tax=Rhodococcus antarcticus TaxID=2987751 RepID=A0ABY6NYQ1_9NOCA|nr:hypothetical protein [Rhodococcus antarcticus]UZJ24522.1 hypothetical protein RHODO2019_15525 [Rhodococcus antarcticus]
MSNKQVPRHAVATAARNAARKAATAPTKATVQVPSVEQTVQVPSVEETKKPPYSLPRTAVNSRDVFLTGTVDQVARNLPVVPLSTDIALPEIPNGTPSYNDKWTDYAYRVIGHSAICTHLDKEYARLKDARGRRALLPSRALLVALFLNALNQRSMNMTDVRDTLFARITPTGRRLLDVPNRDQPARFQDQLAWDERNHALVRRAFRRMLECIDPETIPRNRNMDWAEAEALRKPLPAEEQYRRMSSLTWVVNRLLETVSGQLPDSVQQRRRALGEDFGIDATPMELFARGRGVHNTETSADPCGGYYSRKADHRDPNETRDRFKRTTEKLIYGLDVHLMVAADSSHPDRSYYPSIPFRMTADRPGEKPGAAARRMFATIDTSQHNL